MTSSPILVSGEWKSRSGLTNYRAEWLSDVLVERVSCVGLPQAARFAVGTKAVIGRPGEVWLRFWFKQVDQIYEKYIGASGRSIGVRAPVSMPIQQNGERLYAQSLYLAVWFNPHRHVTVLGEDRFERAVHERDLSPVQSEHAELRIRELTLAAAQGLAPPALVRNFSILLE